MSDKQQLPPEPHIIWEGKIDDSKCRITIFKLENGEAAAWSVEYFALGKWINSNAASIYLKIVETALTDVYKKKSIETINASFLLPAAEVPVNMEPVQSEINKQT